jgi:crotonobetainyl-CoA:carnitine CoA-transferase CaiB-like acyl-CoA transferase
MGMRRNMLSGIRVIEMANVISGPFTGMLLADLGADVIKVEMPGTGDPFRTWAGNSGTVSPAFAAYNRGKRSVELDVKSREARENYLRLVRSADVVIENFRPGVLDRVGVGYEQIKDIAPSLIYCSISGMGQRGPYRDMPTYDGIAQAFSGLWSQLVDIDSPEPVGPPMSDQLTGLYAALGILGALISRESTGEGRRIDVSMLGASVAFQPHAIAEYFSLGVTADKTSRARISQSFAFVCADNLPLAIHLSSPTKFWLALLKTVRREDLAENELYASKPLRERNYETLAAELQAVFQKRDRSEWLKRLRTHDVPCAPLYTLAETMADPQVEALSLSRVFGDGDRAIRLVGYPIDDPQRIDDDSKRPVPLLGEHNREVFAEIAEISAPRPTGSGKT